MATCHHKPLHGQSDQTLRIRTLTLTLAPTSTAPYNTLMYRARIHSTNQWSLIGHWNRDATNSRNLETIAGVEYDSCAGTVRAS